MLAGHSRIPDLATIPECLSQPIGGGPCGALMTPDDNASCFFHLDNTLQVVPAHKFIPPTMRVVHFSVSVFR